MNFKTNGWDSTKLAKRHIFIVVTLLRNDNIKERWKEIERYIQVKIKLSYTKLKWPSL